ncbi:hypothetical protein [Agromyces arachidis]|uniref:hypothetical protein n=1 Tax=Agromyces arachidis TaxID=766966 RepID=UPI0040577E48
MIWLAAFGAVLVIVSVVLILRERKTRRQPGDADHSIANERSHSEAIAAAHTAGVQLGPH